MKKKHSQIKETIRNSDNIEQLPKSKSQTKREMHELQALGKRLTELSKDQLKNIEMPQDLYDAVLFTKSITSHGAKRRQLQHIGKLMREIDPASIQNAFDDIDQGRQTNVLLFKQAESWRDAILAGDANLLEEIQKRFPNADNKKLRKLAINAGKEMEEGKHGKSSRLLFRYLMELLKIEAGDEESGSR